MAAEHVPSAHAPAEEQEWEWESEPKEVRSLLIMVDGICRRDADHPPQRCFDYLRENTRPQKLPMALRHRFIARALARGFVTHVVEVLAASSQQLTVSAVGLLADLAFGSDKGCQAVLERLEDVARCLEQVFRSFDETQLDLLEMGTLLIANLASHCPQSHRQLLPLVRPVILQTLNEVQFRRRLLGRVVLLLANLSLSLSKELQQLGVAQALLDAVVEDVSERSVAESVIVYLHDGHQSSDIDTLVEQGLVANYCVPLLEATLNGTEFRSMFPFLSYTVRVFLLLASCRTYAAALVREPKVVPLLLEACKPQAELHRLESGQEGRRLALLTLRQILFWKLEQSPLAHPVLTWPGDGVPKLAQEVLAPCLRDDDAGVRAAAAAAWAQLHVDEVLRCLLVCRHVEGRMPGRLPPVFWREKILTFIYPFLSEHDV